MDWLEFSAYRVSIDGRDVKLSYVGVVVGCAFIPPALAGLRVCRLEGPCLELNVDIGSGWRCVTVVWEPSAGPKTVFRSYLISGAVGGTLALKLAIYEFRSRLLSIAATCSRKLFVTGCSSVPP